MEIMAGFLNVAQPVFFRTKAPNKGKLMKSLGTVALMPTDADVSSVITVVYLCTELRS